MKYLFTLMPLLSAMTAPSALATDFEKEVAPFLGKYCIDCHSGEDASGELDFQSIKTPAEVADAFEIWESATRHLRDATMPPEGEPQPSQQERDAIVQWYETFLADIQARPSVFRPRRLSVTEYRNTLRSVLGFDLEVDVMEAEQTVTQRSMVIKLLPTDPPGESGYKNDTHANPLTTVAWDQYSYLIDAALEELFSAQRRPELEALAGPIQDEEFRHRNAKRFIETLVPLAHRRTVGVAELNSIVARVTGTTEAELIASLKLEAKTVLMSPVFLYRGLLVSGPREKRQPVDDFELAERLSYFLWADMPDQRLMSLASKGQLADPAVYASEIDRMLASDKSRSLADVFATEWLTLSEIEQVSDNPPRMLALKSQPADFMHYLFTEDRPLMEMIDSTTTFVNPHTSRMYGRDAKQMTKYVKQKGIEIESVPNQKIRLEHTKERGGILTMPGILAMNKGPILRGTWMLQRILGQPLPEPPANVGQVPPNERGQKLTFRQRFEQHRNQPACAVCHNKIDPLGFALQTYDDQGQFVQSENYQPKKRNKNAKSKSNGAPDDTLHFDTSGQLPSGETFEDIQGLKKILATKQRKVVIRNIVQQTLSYALGRKLEHFDRPTVDTMVDQISEQNGTWRDLFHAVSNSVPFRETILSGA